MVSLWKWKFHFSVHSLRCLDSCKVNPSRHFPLTACSSPLRHFSRISALSTSKSTEGISESANTVWLVTSLLRGWLQKHQSKLVAWVLLLSYRSLIKGFYILIQNPLRTTYTINQLQHHTICPTPDLPHSFEALWGYKIHIFQMVTQGYI